MQLSGHNPWLAIAARRAHRGLCRLAPRLPRAPQAWLLARLLNQHLAAAIADGDFDFLRGRWLQLRVSDLNLDWCIGYDGQRLLAAQGVAPDACIAASAADLLAVASGREDPDTLFFQRRLQISGDTELGLTAKNRLDAIERDQLPAYVNRWLAKADQLAQRFATL